MTFDAKAVLGGIISLHCVAMIFCAIWYHTALLTSKQHHPSPSNGEFARYEGQPSGAYIRHPYFYARVRFVFFLNQRGDSSMPGWLWDTVFQYPLSEGDTRTQYSDGSTFVGPLKDGVRHGRGGYFFQDGSRYVQVYRLWDLLEVCC